MSALFDWRWTKGGSAAEKEEVDANAETGAHCIGEYIQPGE